MKKNKKIVILAILITLLCMGYWVLNTRTIDEIEILSENASEEKFQNNNEEYVQEFVKSRLIRENLEEDNENSDDSFFEEGKAIIIYKSNNIINNIKADTISLFNDYEIVDTIELGKLDIYSSSNSSENEKDEISMAIVNSDEYTTGELVEKLNEKNWVISAIPNYEFKVSSLTNDENSEIQWALQNKGQFAGTVGDDINPITTFSEEEKVIAIVDTGVDYTNEDLLNVMWKNPFDEETLPGTYGYDFVNDDVDPMDEHGHGTHCAGIIAAEANNGVGISGAVLGAANIKIMALKVGDANGTMNLNDIVSAYEYILQAQKLGVNIVAVNNSWGTVFELGTDGDEAIQEMKNFVEQIVNLLGENGAISVFAAGNNGLNLDENGVYNNGTKNYLAFPACLESEYEITVAATDSNDELAYFSNYGDVVDIAAPGVDIYSTYKSGYTFNPKSSKKDEYCIYEDFEDDSSEAIDKIIPYIINKEDDEWVKKDGSSICSLEATDEKFYGYSGNALKISVDNSDENYEVDLRFPLTEFGITEFSTYAISLDLYVIGDTDGAGIKLENYGYTYNGGCLVSLETEDVDFYYDLGSQRICESDYWHHWSGVYTLNNYKACEYLDIILYGLGKGQYTVYVDNIVITNDLGDEYIQVLTPYELQSGTSMSTPYVTASVAVSSNQYENYSAKEIKNLILNGSRDKEKFAGLIQYGELDMQSFLEAQEIGIAYGDSYYNYDGKEHTINLTVVKPTDEVEIYYSTEQELITENYLAGNTEKPTFTNPGEYIVYWYVHSTDGEYVDRFGSCKVVIDKKIVINGYNYAGDYDAKEHSISLYSDLQTNEIELYYSTEQELTLQNYNVVGNTIKPTFTDAGEYVVYWYAHSINGILEDISGNNGVYIKPAILGIDLDNQYILRKLTGSKEGWNLVQLKLYNTCYTYTGVEIDPIGTLTFHGNELIKDKDYVVKYYLSSYDEDNMPKYDTEANPINANNKYMAAITGIGNFNGKLPTEEFTIEARNITIRANDQKILEGNQIKTGVDEITVGDEGLAVGQVISEITIESTMGENNEEIIKVSNAIIKDRANNDITSNYNINYVDGKLTTYSMEEVVEVQFNDIGLYKSIVLGNDIETLYEDEQNKKAIFEKNIIEKIESLVLYDNYGKITDLTGLSSFYNIKSLDMQNIDVRDIAEIGKLTRLENLSLYCNGELEDVLVLENLTNLKILKLNNTRIKDIGKILELPNITEVKVNSSCDIKELESDGDKMFLPQFLQITKQTQNNAIITAYICYGENNETEISVTQDENGKLYVILDNEVSENKPAGDRTIRINVSEGLTDGSNFSILYTVEPPLTNLETIQVGEEEYVIISLQYNDSVANNILTRENFPNTNYEIRAIDIYGEILTDDDKIGTGTKIELKSTDKTKIFTLVIRGDVNGDGIAQFKDILLINKHRLNKDKLDDVFLIAGDVNSDEKADFQDILKINKVRLRK